MYWLISTIAFLIISLLIVETVIAKKRKISIYNFSDSFTNLYCGVLERVFDLVFSVLILFLFDHIHHHYAIVKIPFSITTWCLGLIVTDFIAYWFHRLSHQVNFLWAAHIVHHQSEELNITTVFRVSFFAVVFRALFFVWMAFAGFDVFTIVTTSLMLGIYQLFTHSRVIGKLGILEYFLTTPSHHRVHHGRNEKYMDKNYAHIFIFWDRLFGTFKGEEEEPNYGITSGFVNSSAYNATFSYWGNLIKRAKKADNLKDKFAIFLMGPKWTPKNVNHLDPVFETNEKGIREKPAFPISKSRKWYTVFSTIPTFSAFIAMMSIKSNLGASLTFFDLVLNPMILALLFVVLISVFVHSSILNHKKNAYYLELIRQFLLPIVVFLGFKNTPELNVILSLCITYMVFLSTWTLIIISKSKKGGNHLSGFQLDQN